MQQQVEEIPELEIPEDIICPITFQIMTDPVILIESGNTYEREAILEWLKTHDTDPLTHVQITNKNVIPNRMAKSLIAGFLETRKKINPAIIHDTYLPEFLIQELLTALQNNDLSAFTETLNKDSRLLSQSLRDNKNILWLACEYASVEILDNLLIKFDDNIKKFPGIKNNAELPLFLSVSRRLGEEGAERIAKALHWQQTDVQNLLLLSVENNDIDNVKIALSLGAVVSQELLGHTYVDRNKTALFKVLLWEMEPFIQEKGNDLLIQTIQDGHTELSLFLIIDLWDKINPNKLNENKKSVLDLAVQQNQIEVVKALLNHPNIYINQIKDPKNTALDIFYENHNQNDLDLLKLLITFINRQEKELLFLQGDSQHAQEQINNCVQIIDNQNTELFPFREKEHHLKSLLKNVSFFKTKIDENECLKTLQGHSSGVNSVAVLPDGRIVSGSGDNSLKIWDSNSGQCLNTLRGHFYNVNSVAVLPDGRIVSGSEDSTLRVWNSNSGECLITFRGHNKGVCSVAVLPDGSIVSGSYDRCLIVWDPNTGKSLNRRFQDHYNSVNSIAVAVLPDGRIVSSSFENSLKVWNPNLEQCLRTLQGHSSGVNSVAVLPDGRIVSGSYDNSLKVWDINSGQCLRTLQGHSQWVHCVAVLPDGRIVSGSRDNSLKVWDPNTGQCLRTLQGHSNILTLGVTSVAVLPDGRLVSGYGTGDSSLKIWDIAMEYTYTINAKVNNNTLNDIKNITDCRVM